MNQDFAALFVNKGWSSRENQKTVKTIKNGCDTLSK